uniref:C-type lectin domain-containing protein n=1 Tax=Heterorhabditis bacteriophora TaxID=37862 RepID=A0A1I7WBJ5_HETBA
MRYRLVLTVSSFISGVFGVKYCKDTSICQNGGTCYLNSVLPAVKNCADNEVYHMGFCYSFQGEPMNWKEGAKYCYEKGLRLALTERDDDQEFYSEYIQKMLSGVDKMKVCVSMQYKTMFRNWMSQSCDALNYIVCKREVEESANEQSENIAQCMCANGYEGQRCDKLSSIDFSLFGAIEGFSACDLNQSNFELTCSNPNSLRTLINRCEGLTYCEIKSLSETFSETPCPDYSELLLQYRFRCSKGEKRVRNFKKKARNRRNKQENKVSINIFLICNGGYLATDISESAHAEISRHLRRNTKDGSYFWIALQLSSDGRPQWSDGRPLIFLPPSSTLTESTQCGAYLLNRDSSTWASYPCTSLANYICTFVPEGLVRPKEKTMSEFKKNKEVFSGDNIYAHIPTKDAGYHYLFIDCKFGSQPSQGNRWEAPNTNNCSHKWVQEIRAAVDRGDPAEEITYLMANKLESTMSHHLYGGDITNSVSLSSDVLDLARTQFSVLHDRNERQKKAITFTQATDSTGQTADDGYSDEYESDRSHEL